MAEGETAADPRITEVLIDLSANLSELIMSLTSLAAPQTLRGFFDDLDHCERRAHEIGERFARLRELYLDQPLNPAKPD